MIQWVEKITLRWCKHQNSRLATSKTGHDIAQNIVIKFATKSVSLILTLCITQSSKASKPINWYERGLRQKRTHQNPPS